jgi:hypothetical protein
MIFKYVNILLRCQIFILLLLSSCVQSSKFTNVNLECKYLTFTKVKLRIEDEIHNITLRGYISVVHDSLICFEMWGPLGYKVLDGQFNDQFIVKDYYNNMYRSDVLSSLINESGVIFNRSCIEDLIYFKIDSVKEKLERYNKGIITIEKKINGTKISLSLLNKAKRDMLKLILNQKKNDQKEIEIKYYGLNKKWLIKMQIISITNEKKC